MAKKIYEACRRLLTTCANCQPNENILIVTDTDSLEIGMALWDAAEEFPKKTMVMMEPRKMHGEEPTPAGSRRYAESRCHLSRHQV